MGSKFALGLPTVVLLLVLAPSALAGSWTFQSALPAATWYLAGGDSTHAWAISDDGLVARQGDGNTWTLKRLPSFVVRSDTIKDVAAYDRYNVWAVGKTVDEFGMVRGLMYHSTDGGWNWKRTRIRLESTYTVATKIALASPSCVYIVGRYYYGPENSESGNGYLLMSSDGGTTWSWPHGGGYTPGGPGDLALAVLRTDVPGYSSSAWTWACFGSNFMFLKTVNGASEWRYYGVGPENRPWRRVTALFTPGPGVCYYLKHLSPSYEWDLFRTLDGGQTWTRVYSTGVAQETDVEAVWFASATSGWISTVHYDASDPGQTLLRTIDGGATWRPEAVPAFAGFSDMAGAGHSLWAVADDGRVWVRR
jgi:photosystem II stability/assembly factor-like uncharacterized protein